MTIGIYCIRHITSGKRYIGKSVKVEGRIWTHRHTLGKSPRPKDCNRHLWNAVQKYGWVAFKVEILESFRSVDEQFIADRELFWIDHFKTCDRAHGFNLRRDSSTRMIVHDETRATMAASVTGPANPNYGNYWSDAQKAAMRANAKFRHMLGCYGNEWRSRISTASKQYWSDPANRRAVARSVSVTKKLKNDFLQFTRAGEFVRRWDSVEDIIAANPTFKWQNIYSVCSGHKPTYRGYVWRKVPAATFENLLGDPA